LAPVTTQVVEPRGLLAGCERVMAFFSETLPAEAAKSRLVSRFHGRIAR
jgi:hypothetical protein